MSRIFGIVACAIALLVPGWSGQVRSAPSARPRSTAAVFGTATPAVANARRQQTPFVTAHARTQARHKRRDVATVPRKLVLTFDDGPDLATTPLVLDALDRYGFKAAFFVAGRRLIGQSKEARARRALLMEIAARGHLIANHTVRHKNLCDEPAVMDQEIDGNQQILSRMLGAAPRLFRSPFGAHCPLLARALEQRQMIAVGWTIDPQDWRRQPPQNVATYVRERLDTMAERGVLLLHDTHSTGVHALPLILDFIAEERARAEQGQARPLHVLPPTALLPSSDPEPTGLEPLLDRIAANIDVLPNVARP